MNHLLYALFLSCFVFFRGNAQEYPASEESESSSNPTDDLLEDPRIFRLGYSINGIVSVNPGSSPAQGLTWFDYRPGIVIDFSGELDSWHQWLLGFSFGYQELARNKQTEDFFPVEYLSGTDLDGARAFVMKKELKASTYSPMIYSEFNFLTWEYLTFYARAETGATIYGSTARISYKDLSRDKQIPVSDREAEASFNAGLGLGVKIDKWLIGIKFALIYQAQTRVRFRTQEEYLNYTYDFDASTYDFKGSPDHSRFSIGKTGDGSGRRYSPLYFQLGVYFPLNESR